MRVVLHHRHPRGVDDALEGIPGMRLIRTTDDDAIVEALGHAEVFVSFHWNPRFLTDSLKWIQSVSAGVDQFPLETLSERRVVLTSARGVHGPQVAEHAFALLLAMTRGVGISMRDAATETWKARTGEELAGKTIGILGLGTIGEEIGRRAAAWGMRVIGTKRDPSDYSGVARDVFGPDATTEVFRLADVVVSVLPDTPETRGVIGAEQLEALGAGWFVNVGRGSAVDENALVAALDADLRGAGLDVFAEEPLPPASPLWHHPRVVMTPHTAGLSPEYGPRLARIFEANLAAFQGDGAWVNRVV